MIRLRYGNTNTYFIDGLLIDTDMPGTLHGLFGELKKHGLAVKDIKYVLATHYHPDHMGLISELVKLGVKLLLIDKQKGFVHFSDGIFERQKGLNYQPILENEATVISLAQSRDFLKTLGIDGEILPTESHSEDGIALVLDSGECFAGDLEPKSFIEAYDDNSELKKDWDKIITSGARIIYSAHVNDQIL